MKPDTLERWVVSFRKRKAQALPTRSVCLSKKATPTFFNPTYANSFPPSPHSAMLPIIAIDGPAGAGKSTVTKLVAARLGLLFLDTGAMYRAIAWLVLEASLALDDEQKIAEVVSQAKIVLTGTQVVVNGVDVTGLIRSPEVTSKVSAIAALGVVRAELVKQQQAIGAQGGIVAEGRDMCSHVFPDAQVKIFLTASVQERARRRQMDLADGGQGEFSLEKLERSIAERDLIDSTRAISPLKKAADAVEIISDNLTIDEVVDRIVGMYQHLRLAIDNPL
jgi:pantoate ligase / CMP/dCMP kinase